MQWLRFCSTACRRCDKLLEKQTILTFSEQLINTHSASYQEKKIYISLSLPNNGIGRLVQNRGFFLDYIEKSTVISRRTGTSPHNLGLKEESSESRTLGNVLLNLINCLEENQVHILLFKLLNHLLPRNQSYLSWQHKAFLSQESLGPSTGMLDNVLCNL